MGSVVNFKKIILENRLEGGGSRMRFRANSQRRAGVAGLA